MEDEDSYGDAGVTALVYDKLPFYCDNTFILTICSTLTLAVDNFSYNSLQWTSWLLRLFQNFHLRGIILLSDITCLWKFHFIVQSRWFNTVSTLEMDFSKHLSILNPVVCQLQNTISSLRTTVPCSELDLIIYFLPLKNMVNSSNTLIWQVPVPFKSVLAISTKLRWLPYVPQPHSSQPPHL